MWWGPDCGGREQGGGGRPPGSRSSLTTCLVQRLGKLTPGSLGDSESSTGPRAPAGYPTSLRVRCCSKRPSAFSSPPFIDSRGLPEL